MLGSLPALPWLFLAFSTSSKVTPGFRRNRMAVASLTPVTVVTTLTPPDCVLPPTVIEDLVSVSVRVGSVACADAATRRLTTAASETKNTAFNGRRLERLDMRLVLSVEVCEQPDSVSHAVAEPHRAGNAQARSGPAPAEMRTPPRS